MVAALMATAMSTTAGCGGAGGAQHLDAGPIMRDNPHGWTSDSFREGAVFTDGCEQIAIRGHREAVLDSVSLVGARGLQLIGVRLADPRHGIPFCGTRGWPPSKQSLPRELKHEFHPAAVGPAIGATIKPNAKASYQLLLGLKVTRAGIVTRRGIRIDYHIGDQHYSYVNPAEARICTSKKYLRHGRC